MRNKLLQGAGLIVAMSALSACGSLGNSAAQLTAAPSAPEKVNQETTSQAQSAVTVSQEYEQGKQELNRGNVGKAIEYFLKAHRKAPDSLEGINALAVAYDMVGRPDLADRYFNKALALAPQDPDVLNNVGYAHLKRGDEQTAQRYLNEARALSAGNDVILANIALLENKPEPTSDIQEDTPPAAQVAELTKPYVAKTSDRSQIIVTQPSAEMTALAPQPSQPEPSPSERQMPATIQEASLPAPQRLVPEHTASFALEPVSLTRTPEPSASESYDTLPSIPLPAVKPDTLSQVVSGPLKAGLGGSRLMPAKLEQVALAVLPDGSRPKRQEPAGPTEMPALPVTAVIVEPLEAPSVTPSDGKGDSVASVIDAARNCSLSIGEAQITLVNGNGREGMARRTRGWLKHDGLVTARLLNADHYNYASSTIHYRSSARCTAERLAVTFDSLPRLVKDDTLAEDLRVLLGADVLIFDTMVAQAENN
ncbi:LytR C-terminal domain-containing protein [Limibacillus halophilus]|uniref:Flp pilus assembly protein TadD n=1 Tax=Limibacillus halophilus TaxID=1579333 RepID=A0A839SVF2_9PROT|nr:LytR C-terminal domain-containing protein [Limibacillus halophilus]MBB3066288.1 Flp pilus assembly protein TadD [Limibacillus halophilus]